VAIADGKFFNVVLGVMENGNTNIMALVQSGGSEEYKDFNKAFEDKKIKQYIGQRMLFKELIRICMSNNS